MPIILLIGITVVVLLELERIVNNLHTLNNIVGRTNEVLERIEVSLHDNLGK